MLAAAQPAENPFQAVGREFGWEPKLFASQVVLICLVAFVLAKFAYKPLIAMLEYRKQQIAESLENAAKTRRELEQARGKAQEIVNQANVQAEKLIQEARAAAARVQETETQKAIAAAEQIISKAREAAALDHERMLTELRREVGRLVVDTTAKVTGKILTADDQQRLAGETSRQLSA